MEKLVLCYTVLCYTTGDGYSWSADITAPFLYESKEQAEFDLELLWENSDKNNVHNDIHFAGIDISISDLSYRVFIDNKHGQLNYNTPDIYTLDDWFEIYKPQN